MLSYPKEKTVVNSISIYSNINIRELLLLLASFMWSLRNVRNQTKAMIWKKIEKYNASKIKYLIKLPVGFKEGKINKIKYRKDNTYILFYFLI
jgi:hypothetical protein